MAEMISFRPDDDTRVALAALTADGTSVSDAIRSALLESAVRRSADGLRREAAGLVADTADRAEAAAVLRDMELLRAW